MFEKVFKAVPGDKLDWRPEPKARTARELIGHLTVPRPTTREDTSGTALEGLDHRGWERAAGGSYLRPLVRTLALRLPDQVCWNAPLAAKETS